MTFTRLTLGEPRLRGRPKGGPPTQPCTEDLVYGANILQDPGFETSPQDPTGTWGLDFPTSSFGAYWRDENANTEWADEVPDSVYYTLVVNQLWQPGVDPYTEPPSISTADPRSGSRHVRNSTVDGGNGHLIVANYLQPNLLQLCEITDSNGNPVIATTRVEPGDFVATSQWIKCTDTGDSPVADTYGFFLDDTFTFISDIQNYGTALTTSYQEISADGIAPAGAHYFIAQLGWDVSVSGFVSFSVDQDDFVVEVQP